MPLHSALIALALLGADGPPPDAPIATHVRIVEMKGAEWRGKFQARLQLVAQKQGATVWTAGKETVTEIVQSASSVTVSPRAVSNAQTTASISALTTRPYVARLGRVANGPVNRATAVAFEPHVEAIPDGCRVEVAGRALDQGVLARVSVEDSRFLAFHSVASTETVQPKDTAGKPRTLAGTYQVPEVATAAIAGEWLIPNDGSLIVSTGIRTMPGEKGKSLVCERLAIIETKPVPVPVTAVPSALARRNAVRFATPDNRIAVARVADILAAPVAVASQPGAPPIPVAGILSTEPVALGPAALPAHEPMVRPMPPTPSRALPQGVTPDGSTAPLPPLPDEGAEAASFDEESDEARPSPQARPTGTKTPAIPSDVARVGDDDRLLVCLPIGPLMGELRYRPAGPHRFALGLRLGSRNVGVGRSVDQAVTRTSAEVENKAPAAKECEAESSCCIEAGSNVLRAKSIDLHLGANPQTTVPAGRPLRIELPVGESTIHVEVRATKRSAGIKP
jgi:hypothetical protein